ncbi:proteinase inhibitor I4 [Talaromyces proteolyticus]|uniref:Proteinase inhibitor I4 n=1 Tax=Talaromyces proteolyticus TaxID=1131652 RepID=A0AAD4L1E6_9EURO|nr:proteinase inhibitor I4 [Talaromyces proteolyticus]KAH8702090.1 proteinase inhibitor I4 [Talaromyces proteolyticus]
MSSGRRLAPQSVVRATNQLGYDMLAQLCADGIPSSGTVVSALSITIALAMLAGGADENNCTSLCTKLGLGNLDDLTTTLSQLQDTLIRASDGGPQFTIANAVFADKDAGIISTYIRYLERFDAHLDCSFTRLVDGTDQINGWISCQTNGLIPSMLSRQILAQANAVLVNALVFKAKWQEKFNPKNTVRDFPFHTSDCRTTTVEMMFLHQQEVLVSRNSDYTAACLPYESYDSSKWSFIACLPNEDKSVNDILPSIRRQCIPRNFHRTKLMRFGLPKFNLRTQESIASRLRELGYPISGTFPGIAAGFMVEHVIHSVAIVLDENGTEAAAATAVVLTRSRQKPLPSVVFDRPFVFLIVEQSTNVVVFTGVYSAP